MFVVQNDQGKNWNNCIDELKPHAIRLIDQKLSKLKSTHRLSNVFVASVRWDMLHIFMEAELDHSLTTPFFTAIAKPCYFSGHFPCGWTQGDYPKGRLVMY
jgi:hypothetical protein